MTTAERYQICIEYIRQENDLINHRMTWFLAIQGALATGFGILTITYAKPIAKFFAWLSRYSFPFSTADAVTAIALLIIIGIAGIYSAEDSRQSIGYAISSQQRIEQLWIDNTTPAERATYPTMRFGHAIISDKPDPNGTKLMRICKRFWLAVAIAPIPLIAIAPTLRCILGQA